jgi:4-amino-4-deoxy-L-arabinose transferase-like glycosyltransferase
MNRKNLFTAFIIIIISVFSYYPIFHNLGKFQIRMWDEACYANNSIDMLLNHQNILVVEKQGVPDLYNTKPPLVIWMQALSMKVFGINEFAVRLPSAIFGFLTILLVYFFCISTIGSRVTGLLSAGILITAKGFISNHVVRTGDLDAVLVFWLTLGLFVFIDLVIRKPENSFRHFLLLTLSLVLGFLTKGIAGFFFIPFIFIISILFKNYKIYRDRNLYISALLVICICSGYYFIREMLAPGYIDTLLGSEILRFNQVVMKWHIAPFDYYFQNLRTTRFVPFFTILPLALILPFILKSNKLLISICLMIAAAGYFLLISIPAVKLEWYDAPLFPVLSVLVAFSFVETGIFIFRKIYLGWNLTFLKIILTGGAILFLIKPYKEILGSLKYPEEDIYALEFDGAYLKYLKTINPEIKILTVYKKEHHEALYDQVLFYIRAYEEQDQYHIRLTQEMNFQKNEIVMVGKPEDQDKILDQYSVRILDSWRSGRVFQIVRRN